jgi:hypothetical protein
VPTVAPRRQGHRGRQAALAAAVNQDGHTSAPHRGGVARDTSAAVSDRARRRSSAVPTVAPPPRASRTPSGAGCGGDQDGHTSAPSRGGVARDTTPAVSDGAQLRISGEGLSGATPSKGATRGWRRLPPLTAATTAATDGCHGRLPWLAGSGLAGSGLAMVGRLNGAKGRSSKPDLPWLWELRAVATPPRWPWQYKVPTQAATTLISRRALAGTRASPRRGMALGL